MAFHRNKDHVDMSERVPYDFYPTPRLVTVALIEYLQIPKHEPIWEPASGDGHISKVLEEYGYGVHSSDIRQETYGRGGCNFFQYTRPMCPTLITNPPYYLSEQWIRHCRLIGCETFALLLKATYFHSERKAKIFREIPPAYVLGIPWPVHPDADKGHASFMDFSWVVWNQENRSTIFDVLQKPLE